MKNKGIVFFLVALAMLIVAVIVFDFLSGRPDKPQPNPFAYDVEAFKDVDPALIHYRESRQFKIGFDQPAALAVNAEKIYVAGDGQVKVINFSGGLLAEFSLPEKPMAVEVHGDTVFVAAEHSLLLFDATGRALPSWQVPGENSRLTAVAATREQVFVADAGNRRVLRYSRTGEFLGAFDGKTGDEDLHGFIVPSPCFDLDVNPHNELWVVNPGLLALENYSPEGEFRTFWKNAGIKPEGFSGCCNPAHITFLEDGRLVTSEKGLVRVKTYKRSGEFEGVVAPPREFPGTETAPDVAADKNNNIYLLDFGTKMIRMFEPVNDQGLPDDGE